MLNCYTKKRKNARDKKTNYCALEQKFCTSPENSTWTLTVMFVTFEGLRLRSWFRIFLKKILKFLYILTFELDPHETAKVHCTLHNRHYTLHTAHCKLHIHIHLHQYLPLHLNLHSSYVTLNTAQFTFILLAANESLPTAHNWNLPELVSCSPEIHDKINIDRLYPWLMHSYQE